MSEGFQEGAVRRMRIETLAMLIVVAAADFTLVREHPNLFLLVPSIAILIIWLNLVAVQFLALRKPLGAFHLGFIGAGLLYGLLTLGPKPRVLATLIARYRQLTGDMTTWWFGGNNQLMFAEWMILALGLLTCLAGGVLASYVSARYRSRSRAEPVTSRLSTRASR
jgi:hypothetical protein